MNKRPAIKFTTADDDFIRDHCQSLSFAEIGKELNRERNTIRNRLLKLAIVITPEMTQRRWFKKGNISPHKGKKQKEFCSHHHIESLKKARFQRGHTSYNAKRDLEIVLRWQSNGKQYYWIRIGPQKWVQYHIYLWKQAEHEIDEGCIVVFKDNDPLHCVLENLQCITRAESLQRNKLINWSNKRSKLPLRQRVSQKYRQKKSKLLKRTNLMKERQAKKEARIKLRRQSDFSKQLNREKTIADKTLKSVSRKDEINWSKKLLAPYKIKIPDTSNLIPVRVDHKTIIYVKPGADVTTILKLYQKKAS